MQFDKDINSSKAELFMEVRQFMLDNIQDVKEEYKEHITSYKIKLGMYCYLKVKGDYVHIGWGRGAILNDRYDVLIGNGSIVKGQQIYSLDKKSKKIIKDFIDQTTVILIEHDEMKRLKKRFKTNPL